METKNVNDVYLWFIYSRVKILKKDPMCKIRCYDVLIRGSSLEFNIQIIANFALALTVGPNQSFSDLLNVLKTLELSEFRVTDYRYEDLILLHFYLQMLNEKFQNLRIHPLSTSAKFSEKLTFLNPNTQTYACV